MSTHMARRNLFAAGAGCALAALLSGLVVAEPLAVGAIEDRLQQYETRFNRGDAEAVSRLYSEDVVYYGPLGRVMRGRAAVKRHYQGNFAAGFSDMEIDVIEIGVFDDTAYDIARYTISGPDGEPLTGHHLAILGKEGGEWRVQRTLVNVVVPESATEQNPRTDQMGGGGSQSKEKQP